MPQYVLSLFLLLHFYSMLSIENRKINIQDLGQGAASKFLAMQARGPVLGFQEPL